MSRREELTVVVEELVAKQRELGDMLAAEHEARTRAWFESDDPTIKGRDRVADFNSLDLTTDILTLKGEVAALTTQRDYLVFVLTITHPHSYTDVDFNAG